MPSNEDFILHVLVGDTVLPEYEKDGMIYVESNFFTPHSFKQQAEETVNGEIEIQSWPVTPFSVCIEAKNNTKACYYRVYVDGQKVTSKSVPPGTKRLIKGFRDGTLVREFLFSLPRFARDEYDRIDLGLSSKVGLIEVECCIATLKTTQQRLRNKKLEYDQANKKDCNKVTEGNYLMSTTKAGRVVGMKNSFRSVDFWNVQSTSSKLCVKYVTSQTLQDMNIIVIPIPFPTHMYNKRIRHTESKPNLLKRGKNNTNDNNTNNNSTGGQIKVEVEGNVRHTDGVVDNADHVTGSTDHQYTGAPNFVKEEIVNTCFINDETIDLTLDDDDDDGHNNPEVIEITG